MPEILHAQYILSQTIPHQLSMFYCLVYVRELNFYNNRHSFIAAEGSNGVLECTEML
jgi:hypothetical protein